MRDRAVSPIDQAHGAVDDAIRRTHWEEWRGMSWLHPSACVRCHFGGNPRISNQLFPGSCRENSFTYFLANVSPSTD